MSLLLKDLFNQNKPTASSSPEAGDITPANFQAEVLEASLHKLVLLDFWAPWCGPCQSLTPLLEKLATKYEDKIKLAKINIDQQQQLAAQFRIQSVPTVIAFFQGRPVDAFMGALPESQIKQFLEKIIGPLTAGSQELMIEAQGFIDAKSFMEAAECYRMILQLEPEHLEAHIGLARCHALLGDLAQASKLIEPITETKTPSFQSLLKLLEVLQLDRTTPPEDEWQSHYNLALEHFTQGNYWDCIQNLLIIVQKQREWHNRLAEQTLFNCFSAIGNDHPESLKGRRQLAAILFS